MLSFEGKPKFLQKYAVDGFSLFQALGEIGQLQIELHPKKTSSDPHFKVYADVQASLGEEITCKIDEWRFFGTVVGIEYNSASQDFRLILYDALAKFDALTGSSVFAEQTIKDIVSSVAPGGVKIEYVGGFDSTKVKLAIQYQESALRFVKRLLSSFGAQIWCAGDKVYVGAGPTPQSKSLKLEKDVTEFRINTRLGAEEAELESIPYAKNNPKTSKIPLKEGSFGKVQGAAIDLRKKHTGKGKFFYDSFHIIHEDTSYKDTTHFAQRVLRSQAEGRFVIGGRMMTPIDLGCKLTVACVEAGAGEEKTLVRSVNCYGDYVRNEVIWQFEAVNPEAVLSGGEVRQGGLIASTAVVEKTNDDLNRVQVKFPWGKKQSVTPWLRIASPSWGKDHLHYLPPKKGDTVLVVWGQDDMDPVVLGCVTAGDKVGQPKENLVLQTVDGQTISIGEDNITMENRDVKVRMERKLVEIDVAGSKIKMDPNDIQLDANGSITIKAIKGIELKTMKLDIG
jgi:hypothetical protein